LHGERYWNGKSKDKTFNTEETEERRFEGRYWPSTASRAGRQQTAETRQRAKIESKTKPEEKPENTGRKVQKILLGKRNPQDLQHGVPVPAEPE
jgi:hypothetical protein